MNNKWEARRIHNPAEAKAKDEALQAITKKGEAKDPDDMVKEKDDKVPGDEVVHQMKTGNFIRSRAMEMIARSREKVEMTQRMDIKWRKANNHHGNHRQDKMRNNKPRPRSGLLVPPGPTRPRRSASVARTS